VALTLLVAIALAVWYALRQPGPRLPEIDLVGVDPEVAETIQEGLAGVRRSPRSADAWGFLGARLHAYRFHEQALTCYAEAQRLDPGNPAWPYLRAVLLLDSPEPADALGPLEKAASLDGDSPLPRLRLGEFYLEQGRLDEARAQFEALPAEPRAHLRLAQLAAARQAWRDCLRHLDAAAAAPEARKQVCTLRARACAALGLSSAADEQQRLLAGLPDDPAWPDALVDQYVLAQAGLKGRVRAAVELLREHRTQEAVRLLEDTVAKYPESDVAWERLGRALSLLRRYAEAEKALARSLELAPDTGDVWFFLGLMRQEQGLLDEALAAFRKAAERKPADAPTRCKIAACLAARGDRAGAVAAYREALRYQPELREALDGLAGLGEKPR
jgi:tetratricopeptide (TPR) repeat protein